MYAYYYLYRDEATHTSKEKQLVQCSCIYNGYWSEVSHTPYGVQIYHSKVQAVEVDKNTPMSGHVPYTL